MTREEAHDELPRVDSYMQWGVIHDVIDNIYDNFEKEKQDIIDKYNELANKYSDLANKYTELKLKGKK